MASQKCKCGEIVEIPDDPRVVELVSNTNKLLTAYEKVAERLEKLGEKAPPPPVPNIPTIKVKKKRTDTIYQGLFLEVVEEVEYEDEEPAK